MNLKLPKKLILFSLLACLSVLTLIVSCSKSDDSETEKAPSGLAYSPAVLELKTGVSGSSVKPTITSNLPVSYSLTTNPASNGGISINSEGVIKAESTLAVGEYTISVTATNTAGSAKFENVYKVKITANPVLATALTYSPNSLMMEAGDEQISSVPVVNGSTPVTFAVTSAPVSTAISIDNTGKLHFGRALTAGSYAISVTATNAAGAATFNNVFNLTVSPSTGPKNLSYSPNTLNVTLGSTGTSVAPTIFSSGTVSYSLITSPATTGIIINNQGVIAASSSLAAGTYQVSVTATDINGSRSFPNVYTITVGSAAVTFNNDIKAVIQSNCASCHTAGPQTRYDVYANAKNNIDMILDRIKRTQGAAGMMPNGGQKLPQATIDLIQKWKDDGLKE